MNEYLDFLSATTREVLRGSDDDIRRATAAAAELAKRPQDTTLMAGLRAHVILQVFRQWGETGFESHFSQFIAAVRTGETTRIQRKGLRPVR